MNSREVFPDEELRRRIMDFIMAAGQTLLENGAEVFRVEQTMEIMARSFHLREFHVYVLTNGIFASAGTAEISEVRNVPTRTTHLGRVAAVNALSREIAEGSMSLDEAESRLVLARRIPFPKNWVQLVSGMCGAFCFALIFGGTVALVQNIGASSETMEEELVLQAVRSAALTCYAVEGAYPMSLDELEHGYGLAYNKEAYIVVYNAFASNIMPDIQVLRKGAAYR